MNHPLLSAEEFAAYQARIGLSSALQCDLASLQLLHQLHPLAIPFESLDSFCGRTPSLNPADVFDKLVHQKRGGYCFEQNQLFWRVLRTLGFNVKPLAARVVMPDRMMPRTHMVLLVNIDGIEWLSDVGFGGMTMTAPLQLRQTVPQLTPHEHWQVQPRDDEYVVSAQILGQWQEKFCVSLAQQLHEDYEMANYAVATFPTSRFRNELIVARVGNNGRHALNNRQLSYHDAGSGTSRSELNSASEVMDTLLDIFGIDTSNIEGLQPRLAALFGDNT